MLGCYFAKQPHVRGRSGSYVRVPAGLRVEFPTVPNLPHIIRTRTPEYRICDMGRYAARLNPLAPVPPMWVVGLYPEVV